MCTQFTVEARDANGNRVTDGGDDCEVLITTPSGAELLSSIVDYGNGLYDITYAPNEPGEYSIVPMLNGTPINPGISHSHSHSLTHSLSLSLSLSRSLAPSMDS